ncbi:MAG: sugar transferase, partial [Chitinivibrionia bacterium]|nr:sugar transferase [Chitinivibrionia bacterium]
MKKDLAAFRYIDEKVLPLYIPDTIGPSKDMSISRADASVLGLAMKRAIDIGSSLFVLVFGMPFYLLIASLIKLTSEGPVLYV